MFTSDHEIARIGEGVCDRTLPKLDWTHAAHVAAAVWLLDDRGRAAFTDMRDIIRAYNEATGVANTDRGGYHHTITLASLAVFEAVMGAGSLSDRVNRLLRKGYDRPDWILDYYSRERLFSVEARRGWVAPDLRPLPTAPIQETS